MRATHLSHLVNKQNAKLVNATTRPYFRFGLQEMAQHHNCIVFLLISRSAHGMMNPGTGCV
jgi:hypothetical protein